jgi:hypothetical protein
MRIWSDHELNAKPDDWPMEDHKNRRGSRAIAEDHRKLQKITE